MKKIKSKFKQFDLLEIDWIDSVQNTAGWSPLSEFNFNRHYAALPQRTVGYFIQETKETISTTECRSVDKEQQDINGLWTIPKGCINKITKIKTRSKNHARG